MQKIYKTLLIYFLTLFSTAHGALAGGRPNAISEGQNAFAGVVNPANAVWIEDRFDIGAFWLHQKSSITNVDNNPLFLNGKTDLTYKTKNLITADAAVHKRFKLGYHDSSLSVAYYTTPSLLKLRTKEPIPSAGTTPVVLHDIVEAISVIFSFKISEHHSLGASVDYFYLSHLRKGFQNSDNLVRSVSPGHVTNNGVDHSHGIGCTLGWRWRITKTLDFGLAWIAKAYCGQYRKYRGYEPHHAQNYVPQVLGGGFRYLFTSKLAGRIEVLWSNLSNLPGANNNILSNGQLNRNKRGSRNSPGPGLRDATIINIGLGYKINDIASVGASFSHRIKPQRSDIFISHTADLQTIYDIFSVGVNLSHKKYDLFLSGSYGFKNRISGKMPLEIGGGRFTSEKQIASLSFSLGYKY